MVVRILIPPLVVLSLLPICAANDGVITDEWKTKMVAAKSLAQKGDYRAARAVLKQLVTQYQAIGPGDSRRAALFNNLRTLHYELGDDYEAERCYRLAIRAWEHGRPKSHAGLAAPLNNLGNRLAWRGRHCEAWSVCICVRWRFGWQMRDRTIRTLRWP
jgi:tetratricopeptide (TPR) repeat protein